ncbi:hypothetical protein J4N45_10490 [Vibrio sp. SCSIO 43140]|uniref:hypothetical protein n=1 Tax=Vibrio sp. SCSIO 43140 TaxID=2819100 RepID=UPI0020753550|nr:hypothetical protein [Vibrio sp. SCSIO 43140]USD58958.1 hypothetical protein J4N45_10490 [Vibrio sp. SCSIO 43140]
MSLRLIHIENLQLWINEREGSDLTFNQVQHFVQETSLDDLFAMVKGTQTGETPVLANEVLAACEGVQLSSIDPECEPLIQDQLASILLSVGE